MNMLGIEPLPNRDEQAAIWYLNIVQEELSDDDQKEFEIWLSHPENLKAFEEAARLWNDADRASEMPEVIQLRSAALQDFNHFSQRWPRRLSRPVYLWGSIAATLLAIVGSTALLLHQPVQRYQTGIGGGRVVVLDDGSSLALDADTEVEVRMGRNRRELTLTHGRAEFDVAKDPLRPFTVAAAGKLVVATGTAFSVELLRNEFLATLYHGNVAVLNEQDEKPLIPSPLRPGQQLAVSLGDKAKTVITSVDPANAMAWRTGQLSFENEPIASAVERMNRYSRKKLVIASSVAGLRVNGVFEAGDANAFVEAVTALSPLQAVYGDGQITLVRKQK
ncbi:FecR domain-containing protein [Sphingobium sp. AN558]|uniref:FecR family protein n=1 Tax=Sphingobium sp. AN558 TaxID=3133442 RepID=UPI0030C24453